MSAVDNGSTPDGTKEKPYLDIADAFNAVQEISASTDEKRDYVISLSKGEYVLEDTLTIDAYSNYQNAAYVTLDGNGSTVKRADNTAAGGIMTVSDFINLTIDDIIFENAADTLLTLTNCMNSVVKNSTFRNGTKNAVRIQGGESTGLRNCEIYSMGAGGVSLGGGDRNTLAPGKNYVDNCSIHDCQQIDTNYTALVSMSGVGNSVTNSDIYNSKHLAIAIYGNDLLVKDNKLWNVCNDTSDMGAIYAEGDWALRGTVIEHNYIENVPAKGDLGAFAIYLDNGLSGVTVKDNVFKNIACQAVYVNGGRDNTVTNNIFINTGNIGAVTNFLCWGAKQETIEAMKTSVGKYVVMDVYSKYTNFENILEDDPIIPKYNKFSGNVLIDSLDVSESWLREMTKDELISAYGCEFTAYECDYSDLTNYAEDDYTLSEAKAQELGFTTFTNTFGRQ